jgi:hypothetical protein
MFKNKKLLPFLFLLIISMALTAGIFTAARIENDNKISNVRISNLSSNSVSISWLTEAQTQGEIIYSTEDDFPNALEKLFFTNEKNIIAFDDRNVKRIDGIESTAFGNYEYDESIAKNRTIHHVTLRNLEPSTQYFFRINGRLTQFEGLDSEKNEIISFKTLGESENIEEPNPVYGSVVNYIEEEPGPSDGIVYYQIVDATDLENRSSTYSSLVSADGGWTGELSNILDSEGQSFSWNSSDYLLHTDIYSNVGSGYNRLELDELKPVRDSIVNVRYIPEN